MLTDAKNAVALRLHPASIPGVRFHFHCGTTKSLPQNVPRPVPFRQAGWCSPEGARNRTGAYRGVCTDPGEAAAQREAGTSWAGWLKRMACTATGAFLVVGAAAVLSVMVIVLSSGAVARR